MIAEGSLRWILPSRLVYIHPKFVVLDVEHSEQANQMAGPMLGSVLQYVDKPRKYRLKRNLRARYISSEFDVSFETNALGLRGPAIKNDTTMRILGLGDSFAMGFGVEYEETYLSVLHRLIEQYGFKVEMINAGVVGYNLYNSYHYLTDDGIGFDPDVVILQIWVGDDLPGGSSASYPLPIQETSLILQIKTLARHSYLSMFIRDRFRSNRAIRRWLMEHNMLVQFRADRLLHAGIEDEWSPYLTGLASLLNKYQVFCNQHDIRFIILLVPIKEQVYEEYWNQTLEL